MEFDTPNWSAQQYRRNLPSVFTSLGFLRLFYFAHLCHFASLRPKKQSVPCVQPVNSARVACLPAYRHNSRPIDGTVILAATFARIMQTTLNWQENFGSNNFVSHFHTIICKNCSVRHAVRDSREYEVLLIQVERVTVLPNHRR